MTERTFRRDEAEYRKLEAAAALFTAFSKHGYQYRVTTCYLDWGQDWLWTTIDRPCTCAGAYVQVLCPRDWNAIVEAKSPVEIAEAVRTAMEDEFFSDK